MNVQFPQEFVWGAATAAYQIEGATNEDGRGESIWDHFSRMSGTVVEGHTGDIACDHYHRFEEDVKLMQSLGLKAYRFSIAWPRIIPEGTGEINQRGIDFYNRLINCLLDHDITPWVTLYHWDLPQVLEEQEGGWLNKTVISHFEEYARICFDAFGDRVKHWITLNEPWCSAVLGYGIGVHAPGKSSSAEAYRAAHHMILAHARAVRVYRKEFTTQGGTIGITNNCDFRFPLTDSEADRAAAQRSLEFFLGWFADPIWKGTYPAVMREMVGDKLPTFTAEERSEVLGSSDFFGLNHYGSMMASEPEIGDDEGNTVKGNGGLFEDQRVHLSNNPLWKQTHMEWNIVPEGLRDLLLWIDERYAHPTIYITENGCACDEPDYGSGINDVMRRDFIKSYLTEASRAIDMGVDLQGYFAWSLLDNYEWAYGYTRRFGLCRVEYDTQERTPKLSALWYRDMIATQELQ